MKTLTKAIALASLTAATAVQAEGLSTTVGAVSDYYFRSVHLGDAGAYASIDYNAAGFYAGVWAIDDGAGTGTNNTADGLETDFYVGYGWSNDDIAIDVNYTAYEYTGSSDSESEFGISASMAGFTVFYATGEDENDQTDAGDDYDYDVITLAYDADNWGLLVGSYDADQGDLGNPETEYKWIEFAASQEVAGLSFTATIGHQFDNEDKANVPASSPSTGQNYLVLDVSKSFDL